jgi:3-oxoacyl-[acyl-carrier protein] reductase
VYGLSELSRSLEGTVVLNTGAASGRGRAEARVFADEGAKVAVTDLTPTGVESVVDEIVAAGATAAGWTLDVTDSDAVERVVGAVVDQWGTVDVLVNNAGVSVGAPIDADGFDDQWDRALDVLLTGQQRMIRACLPHLIAGGDGRIVNIATTEGLGATPGLSPYPAATHGVVGLTRSLAVELGARGVTVNCVCPGPILTAMTDIIPEEMRDKFARRTVPLRRYGTAEEVAHVVVSLALPASSFLNGAVIPVDGGLIAKVG